MPGRVVSVTGLGNLKDLEAAFRKAGLVVDETADTMANSAKRAGAAAAEQAKQAGAAADTQAAAAGRAAAEYTQAQDQMTRAQKAAAAAAADAAKRMGLSADEQEAAAKRAAAAADMSGGRISKAFEDGTSKAGSALTRLGKMGESWAIPFAGSITKIGKQFDDAETKGKKLESALAGMGKLTLGAGTVGFGAAAYEGVKGAAALQKQMEMIHTQASASQTEVKNMTGAVMGMSASVGTGPQQLAEGLYHVESVGLRGAKALGVLKIAAEGAKVGNANLVDVTNALDAAIVSGISGVQNYGQAMGSLNSIVGSGDMKMQDLADALGTGLLGPMKTYGLSIKDVGAALAVFGDNNIRGQDAATKLTSAVRIMAAPSAAASKALGAIGLSTLQLSSDMHSGGLIKAFQDLQQHLTSSGATAEQQGLIISRAFGGRQSTGVQVLLHQVGRLEEKYKTIDKGSHSFGSDWITKEHELSFETEQLHAGVTVLADKLGMTLIPKLQELGHDTAQVISWMEKHKAIAEALGLTISGVLGLAVAVYAEQKAVRFIGATREMTADLGKFVSAVETGGAKVIDWFRAEGAAAAESAAQMSASATESSAAVEAEAAKMQMSFEEIDAGFAGTATAAEGAAGGIEGAGAVAATATPEITGLGLAFESLLGPIGLVSAAVLAFHKQISEAIEATGEFLGLAGKAGPTLSSTQSRGAEQVTEALNRQKILDTGGGIMAFFESKGLSPAQAAGIVGNLQQESSLNPKSMSGSSYGLAQWEGSRLAGLRQFAGQVGSGRQGNSTATQLEYLWHELTTGERGTLSALRHAKTPREAARIFEKGFERAKIPMLGQRERFAEEALKSHPHASIPSIGESASTVADKPSKAFQEWLGEASGHKKKTAAALGVPAGVTTMLATAQALLGTQYTHGGGHNGWDPIEALKKIGVDCSGFVSRVLHSGGLSMPGPQTTAGLPSYLAKGHGRYVTVYDRPSGSQAHTLIEILGHMYESGGNPRFNPHGGVSMLTKTQAAGELAGGGFEAFHPTGSLNTPVRGGVSEAVALRTSGATVAEQIAASIAAQIKTLENKGHSVLKTYQSDTQTGSIKPLEKLLGYSSTQPTGQGSEAHSEFEHLVSTLRAAHIAGLTELAGRLTAAHSDALHTLDTELRAAEEKADARKLSLEAVEMKDQIKIAEGMANRIVQEWKDATSVIVDQIENGTTALKDAGQSIADEFSAAATAIKDHTQEMTVATSVAVQQIHDKSQTEADILGERGLYGLNLVAQQQQVQLDQMMTGYDQQIGQAERAIAKAQTETDNSSAVTQAMVDAVTSQQDALVGQAKSAIASTEQSQDAAIQSAEQKLDYTVKETDRTVQEAENRAAEVATGSQAQQQAAQSALEEAKAHQAHYIAEAEAALATAKSASAQAVQQAQNALSVAEANAAKAEQEAQNALGAAKGQAEVVLAQANKILAEAQDRANIAEAEQQAVIEKIKAEASTQYAGSGLTVNIEGVNPTDAAVIASEVGWVMRTQVPA